MSDVDNMDGHDFEYYCADLLRYDGFSQISVTKGSNDQGVDIIAYKSGDKYAIQCKRYNNALGNKPVQEVNTGRAIYNCSQAIVLTNNYFTKGAIEAASATGVILWDRKKLDSLIRAKQQGTTTKTKPSFLVGGEHNKKSLFLYIGIGVAILAVLIAEIGKPGTYDSEMPQVEATTTVENLELTESAVLHDISITVTSMLFARHNGNLKYLDMVEGEFINCCIYVNVENKKDHPVELTGYDVVLVCDDVEYQQLLIEDPEFLFFYHTIAPRESINGKIIDFQIPKSQQHSDSQIFLSIISSDGQKTIWQLR